MIYYKCPHCQMSLSSPDFLAGREELCISCGKIVAVPGPDGQVSPATPPADQQAQPPQQDESPQENLYAQTEPAILHDFTEPAEPQSPQVEPPAPAEDTAAEPEPVQPTPHTQYAEAESHEQPAADQHEGHLPPPLPPMDDGGVRLPPPLPPTGGAYRQQYSYQQVRGDQPGGQTGTSALVMGIVAISLFFVPILGVVLAVIGIVMSVSQKKQIKNGMTGAVTTGLVLSIVSLVLGAISTLFIIGVTGAASPSRVQHYEYPEVEIDDEEFDRKIEDLRRESERDLNRIKDDFERRQRDRDWSDSFDSDARRDDVKVKIRELNQQLDKIRKEFESSPHKHKEELEEIMRKNRQRIRQLDNSNAAGGWKSKEIKQIEKSLKELSRNASSHS